MAEALPLPPLDQTKIPCLDRLGQLATVNVHQTSWGYNGNNYTVLSEEDPLFTMNEVVPDTFFRGGAHRAFVFDAMDSTGRKLFKFRRPLGRFFISDMVELLINDELASIIRLERTFMTPIFSIADPQQRQVIRLKGKISEITVFQLQTNQKAPIGSINKKWLGWKKELTSRNTDFIITFPADLALQYKLAVIVACVYIDFRFFEGK